MADGTSNIMEVDATDGGDALDSRSFHGSTLFLSSEKQGLTASPHSINADSNSHGARDTTHRSRDSSPDTTHGEVHV